MDCGQPGSSVHEIYLLDRSIERNLSLNSANIFGAPTLYCSSCWGTTEKEKSLAPSMNLHSQTITDLLWNSFYFCAHFPEVDVELENICKQEMA